MEIPYVISLAGISGSDTMSKNIASSEFYELASDVKDKIVTSDDKPEIIVGGPQEELEQHERSSHSKLEQYEFDRDTFQIESPSIDIKYEVDYIEHNPTSDAEDHLDRVHSPSSLTSVVKSEPDIDRLEIHYFDHSSAIQRNLKTEPEDEDGNCEDPLSGADSMPLGQLAGTSIEVLGQYSSEMIQTGEESCFRRLSKQSNHGEGESEREKSFSAASRPNKDKIDRTADKKMRYKCENCEKTFDYRSLLTIHAMCHSGEKPFKCDTCGKSFAQTSHLTRHKICHSGVKPFECDACGKYYARKESLIEHMMTHNAEHPFMCETCGKSFATKRSLTDHRTIHTGMQPFKCDICGLGITTKANFTVHMRTHNGENPFKCETCGRSFALKTSLIGHMRTHTGDKPFQCDTCGRSFAI